MPTMTSDTDSIYHNFKEHKEFPIEDARRFTVEIKKHGYISEPKFTDCGRCGYPKNAEVHK